MSDPQHPSSTPSPIGSDAPTPPEAGGTGSGSLLRGRALAVAAAVAVGVIAAVVIVSLNRDSSSDDEATGDAVDIAADDTVATAPEPGTSAEVSTEGPFDVNLGPAEDGLLQLTVDDPMTPALTNATSQHCVLVTLSGPTTVEAFGCVQAGATDAGRLQLSSPGDPLVGCAAVATQTPPDTVGATAATSQFVVDEGAVLPTGTYDVTVVAVTGVGDGCMPLDGSTERAATARSSIELG